MSRKSTGAIGLISDRFIRGWAGWVDDPAPVRVSIRVNAAEIAQIEASAPRGGLVKRGLHPTGLCGFELKLGETQRLAEGDIVSVHVVGSDEELSNSPMRCEITVGEGATTLIAVPLHPTPVAASGLALNFEVPEFPRPPHRSNFRIFRDSLLAFFLREIRNRFGKSRMGYAWALIQPVIFMVALGGARYLVSGGRGGDVHGVTHLYFLWIGLIPFFMFLHGFNQSLGASRSFKGLFNYRQVQPIDILIVRVFIEFLSMSLVFLILLAGFAWLGFSLAAEDWLTFLSVLLFLFMLTLGAALLAEVAVAVNPEARTVINMVERPLLFVSGAFYTIEDLSPDMRIYLLWNPILHGVDLGRGALLHEYDSPGSWLYFAGFSLLILILGLGIYRRHHQRLGEE